MGNKISIGCAYKDQDLVGSTIDDSVVGGVTPAAGSFTALSASGALSHTGSTAGFYGKVAVAQRGYSSAVHATSAASVSATFGATQLAILQELMLTNIGLGIWATV